MTTIQTKNELDFLAQSHETKRKMFDAMCNSILSVYNKLSGKNLKLNLGDKSSSLLRLFDKMDHMVFNLYSPDSISGLLKRIATKPIKVIAKPEYKDQPEIYGKGHFRWDFKAYTLDENELKAIQTYLGLHIENSQPAPKKIVNKSVKPDFEKITDYKDQADAFLLWTETTLKVEFKEHALYFADDKETRDIYYITLKNKNHRYKFTFGQSISCIGKIPTNYDVLSCIQKYEVYDFDTFCGDFGYEKDSRNAYKTYKAVKKEWENVSKLFTKAELALLQEIN